MKAVKTRKMVRQRAVIQQRERGPLRWVVTREEMMHRRAAVSCPWLLREAR